MRGMFDQHGSFLEERMDPDSGLLDKLLANKTLSKIEFDNIKDHRPFYRRNAQLLSYIRQKNKYDNLIGALKDTRQGHLVNYLIENGEYKSEYGGDWPLMDDEVSILDTNQESLVDLVDCSDLVVRLFSAQVINGRQREAISAEPTNHRRNEVLLDILRRRCLDDYIQMVRCLYDSNQGHIADILDKGGVVVRVRTELGTDNDAVQTEDEIVTRFTKILSSKSLNEANRILKEIELTVIAAKKGHSVVLYVYCRTATELIDLREMQSSGKLRSAIQRLFSQLLLFSVAPDAEVTVENLNAVVEGAFTQLLYRSQIDRLTVTLPANEYAKCRPYFSDECITVCAVYDLDRRKLSRRENEELKKTTRSLTKVQGNPSYSLVLSFKKGDHMVTTTPANNIGDKDDWWKVKHLGNGKIGYIPRNRVVIDYSEKRRTTSRKQRTWMTAAPSTTTVNDLPLELVDIILRKSYLHYLLNRDRSKNHLSDRFLIARLSAVATVWFERLRRRWFKLNIWRHLSAVSNRANRMIIILRNNQSFLMENIQPCEGLVDHLRSSDCLTDVQARLLSRKTANSCKTRLISRKNSSELLHIMRTWNDARRSVCIRCLRQSNQKLVTKVVENGGVVLKVNLWNKDAEKLKQLSERLNNLRDKTKERSQEIERAISQVRDKNIEILSSQLDRQATLWLWCQSQTDLEILHSLYESNCVGHIIGDLTKVLSSTSSEYNRSGVVDTDGVQFKKTVVVCPIVVKFTVRLGVNKDEEVKGVTKLREEIYVLCRTDSSSSHAIRVFQNRNPFRPNAKIEISEIDDPEDIGSSEEKNCVYVTDSKKKCVWKITRRRAVDHQKLLDWQFSELQLPSTLSVSNDGQLLMVTRERSVSVLKVFGPDAELRLFIRLPSDIKKPRHAVETSNGHFVVLHSFEKYAENGSGAEEKKQMFAVSKVTRDGQTIVCRFSPQTKGQELRRPFHLALDSDDRVFVADEGSNRVILLDSNLNWNRIVCPTEDEGKGIRLPKRLCYDEVERQLIVAGFFRGEGVNIYSVNRN